MGRHLDRKAGRGSHRYHHGSSGAQRLLNELEARPSADGEDSPLERQLAGEQCVSDHLVDSIVATHIFPQTQQFAVRIEERSRMDSAGHFEQFLLLSHAVRETAQEVERTAQRFDDEQLLAQVVETLFAADTAGRRRSDLPMRRLESLRVELSTQSH
jgi:hypothetical protein